MKNGTIDDYDGDYFGVLRWPLRMLRIPTRLGFTKLAIMTTAADESQLLEVDWPAPAPDDAPTPGIDHWRRLASEYPWLPEECPSFSAQTWKGTVPHTNQENAGEGMIIRYMYKGCSVVTGGDNQILWFAVPGDPDVCESDNEDCKSEATSVSESVNHGQNITEQLETIVCLLHTMSENHKSTLEALREQTMCSVVAGAACAAVICLNWLNGVTG